jgi:poly(A) polymerase
MWKADGTLNHLGSPAWLADAFLQTLMQAFEDAGHQIYAVGGCVRDTVLDRGVKDVDLSTDARPDETIRIIENLTFRGKPWKAVPPGIERGTVTAVSPSRTYEITTFRKDIETDGRHAVVAFSTKIEDDALRRDFTINAFYADREGRVKDIVGGSGDLRERRIRFIGDPVERIQEDYLRILRFFRFTASHGRQCVGIDPDGLAACSMLADGLDRVSRERIGAEFTRIIGNFNAAPTVGTMEMSGVLMRVLPGASVATLARLIDLEETYPIEGRMLPPNDVPTRLASLGCADITDRLRLSNAQADKITLVLHEAGSMTPAHELGYRHGFWSAVHCLLLRWATLLQPFDEASIDLARIGANAKFPITAADLMPAYTGKALGDRLRALESTWIASDFELTKALLLAIK